jgi:hypothetical protein
VQVPVLEEGLGAADAFKEGKRFAEVYCKWWRLQAEVAIFVKCSANIALAFEFDVHAAENGCSCLAV